MSTLTVEEIMQRIKQEVEKKETSFANDEHISTDQVKTSYDTFDIKNNIVDVVNRNTMQFVPKDIYEYPDFTKYHDVEFITNAYKGILKREPMDTGLNYHLSLLRNGEKSKSEIISILRYSKEGRQKNVKLLGSKKRYFLTVLYSLPIIGYISKLAVSLMTLPKLLKRLNSYESFIYQLHQISIDNDIKLQHVLNTKPDIKNIEKIYDFVQLKADKTELLKKADKSDLYTKADRSELEKKADISELKLKADKTELLKKADKSDMYTKADRSELEKKADISELKLKADKTELLKKADKSDLYTKADRSELEKKADISELKLKADKTELLKKADKSDMYTKADRSELENNLTEEEQQKFEEFYIAFEDKFRGEREEIKERLKVYLPYIEKLPFEKEAFEALDVGCGRGEWLELLRDNGYTNVKGIDISRTMVSKNQALGLNAIQSDLMRYLKKQPDESLSVITGFHIIEHLPFKVLMELYEESYRVLKKGGIVIFETPNPENIIVGAYSFYTDPTHRNPLVPETIEFLAKQVGFSHTEIKKLHKYSDYFQIEGSNALIKSKFLNEMDYSIIGYKK